MDIKQNFAYENTTFVLLDHHLEWQQDIKMSFMTDNGQSEPDKIISLGDNSYLFIFGNAIVKAEVIESTKTVKYSSNVEMTELSENSNGILGIGLGNPLIFEQIRN